MTHRLLRFDWEAVHGAPVRIIRGRDQQLTGDGSFRWSAVAFVVGEQAFVLTVTANSDEIIAELGDVSVTVGWGQIPSLSFALNKGLGWCWSGVNSQGYSDAFTIAFDPEPVTPRLQFLAEGSQLTCIDLTPHRG